MAEIRRSLVETTNEVSTLYGWRVQALFEAVVATIGEVRLLKQEDSGDVYFAGEDIVPPDFRMVTDDGDVLLVEVKNAHTGSNPDKRFTVTRKYLRRLARYVELMGSGRFLVALYWTGWNSWTLVDPAAHDPEPGGRTWSTTFVQALAANEMHQVGDHLILTEWPLEAVVQGTALERAPAGSGRETFSFDVTSKSYRVAGRPVTTADGTVAAETLIFFGGWPQSVTKHRLPGNGVEIHVSCEPVEHPPGPQRLGSHGTASSIYAALFLSSTTGDGGELLNVRVPIRPASLDTLVPGGEAGDLPITRIKVVP